MDEMVKESWHCFYRLFERVPVIGLFVQTNFNSLASSNYVVPFIVTLCTCSLFGSLLLFVETNGWLHCSIFDIEYSILTVYKEELTVYKKELSKLIVLLLTMYMIQLSSTRNILRF